MRDNISENWCKKLVGAGGPRDHKGGQGVYREVESERHEEKDRAVIKEATPDEPVGQRWGKVESALWGRRRYSFTHRNKVYADGTIRKNRAMTQENSSCCRFGSGISDPISKQAKRGVKREE